MEKKRKRRTPQRLQFSLIGISNAAVDIGALNLLLILFPTDGRVALAVFNTIAYVLAVVNSYIWNSFITFKRTAKGTAKQRLKFVLQGLVSLGINNGIFLVFDALLRLVGMPAWIRYNIAKAISMFASFSASYVMMKYFVFRR